MGKLDDAGEQPPPYTREPSIDQHQPPRRTDRPSSPSSAAADYHPSALTTHIRDHVTALSSRLRANGRARQALGDTALLDHILPHVESFLADLGAQHRTPPLATLTLVPAAALLPDAVLSGHDDARQRREVSRVARVATATTTTTSDGKAATTTTVALKGERTEPVGGWEAGRRFAAAADAMGGSYYSADDNTGDLLWWRDEDMARRLASHLQPQPHPRAQAQAAFHDQRPLPTEGGKKGWWGKLLRGDRGPESRPNSASAFDAVLPAPPSPTSSVVGKQVAEGAEINITAEQVAFRRENEFGIWESMSGWAIIVAVKFRSSLNY